MQVASMKRQNRPLVLLRSQAQRYQSQTLPALAEPKALNALSRYVLQIPLLGLTIKIIRLIYQIFAFIISVLAGKPLIRPQQAKQVSSVSIKQESSIESDTLKQEKQLQDHFLVMASHELKTPMTTIRGQVQLVLRRLARMPELSSEMLMMRSAMESIDGQTRRLSSLVDDLLDLYNVRAGKTQLHLAPCDLVEMCSEVAQEQRQLTGRTIELEVSPTAVILEADCDRLRQVIVNLISNAMKYSPDESPVSVLVAQRRDIGIIEVSDSGPGIPAEQQTHIFEPFYRCPNVQASSKSGLGLGLAICKDIVERHAGRIWCRSRVGKGSTFIIELPLKRSSTRKLS